MKDLTIYNKKRKFNYTPEPPGTENSSKSKKKLQFVIQKHDASHLHYDFRLELNGVLKSWAVPKGPSMNPSEKRLAVMVEDHPLSYGKFEGIIPEGNYGAGTVEIWDKGWYEPVKISSSADPQKLIARQLEEGNLKFTLQGTKLKGVFVLIQLNDGKDKNWLLIKQHDEHATSKTTKSAESSKTKNGTETESKIKSQFHDSVKRVRGKKLSDFIIPMLAKLHTKPFSDPAWVYEIKWDGYRAIAELKKGEVSLYSRNGLSFAGLYPSVVNALRKINKDAVLDGEIVVIDKDDNPSFQKLQQYGDNPSLPLLYYVFDCLSYNGKDLTKLSLLERKKIAREIIPADSTIRFSDHVEGSGEEFFANVVKRNMEGIIAKRSTSLYHPGKRTGDWLKIKNHNTQEAIIAGYTAPKGSRKYIGALLLGIKSEGKLTYIGHTGTGFNERLLSELYEKMQPLVRKTSAFSKKIPVNGMVTWIEPVLVCELKFAELTEDGILRQPVFMGLRIDKSSEDVNQLDTAVNLKDKIKATRLAAKKTVKSGTGTLKKINGHTLKLTNLDKVYWPKENITKGDVIDYYNSVHKFILPYLKDRPESLRRNPNGIEDDGFFHKDAGDAAPEWVKSIAIHSESTNKDVEYIICNDRATLTYLNNLGCIEINPWNSRIKQLDKPDYLVMDIDPSDNNSFEQVIDTALAIKQIFDRAGALSYCKTSGASGLHVYVPLHAAYTYDQIRQFAELIALLTNQVLPHTTTLERSLTKREGKIYLDHLQNKRGQTLASVYSVRPVPGASVSTPLLWKEVKYGLNPLDYSITTIKKRLDKLGDIFKGVLKEKIDLMKCIKALGS